MKNYNTNNALQKHKVSDKIKWIIVFSLILVILAGMVGISVHLIKDKGENVEELSESVVSRQYAYVGGDISLDLTTYEQYYLLKNVSEGKDCVITVKFDFVPENAEIIITPILSGSVTDEGYTAVFDKETSVFTLTLYSDFGGVGGWKLYDSTNDITISLYLLDIE